MKCRRCQEETYTWCSHASIEACLTAALEKIRHLRLALQEHQRAQDEDRTYREGLHDEDRDRTATA
jgi:hypothetical protein